MKYMNDNYYFYYCEVIKTKVTQIITHTYNQSFSVLSLRWPGHW